MGLVLLDLDGTIVEDAIHDVPKGDGTGTVLARRQHELYSEPTLLPHVYDTLKRHADEDDAFAIVTNQGGVALGYHTQAEVYARIGKATQLLSLFWGQPFSVHVAFCMPKGYVPGFKGDDGRKPAPTMLQEAMLAHGSMGPGVLMIGDRDEDRDAAAAAAVDFRLAGDFFGW